jgi:hypothetical protein
MPFCVDLGSWRLTETYCAGAGLPIVPKIIRVSS